MPLDTPQKTAHILQVVARTLQGRVKTITAVYENAGVYTYVNMQLIFRKEQVIDPSVINPSGQAGNPAQTTDIQVVAALGTNFTGVVYLADTPTATAAAVAAAQKYEIIEVLPVGIVPGGSHLRVLCRRLR